MDYSIEEFSQSTFSIDSNGTIFTATDLDREREPSYTFRVTVTDGAEASEALSATCMVQVTLDDVNDQSPTFDPIGDLAVPENAPSNTPIATLKARDGDEGRNAEVKYYLEDSISMKFGIGRIDGVLRTLAPLDREEVDTYDLLVTAVDSGSPALSSQRKVRVKVADENDNAPKFSQRRYRAKAHESAAVGEKVLETNAVDLDEGRNAKLRFSIISGDLDQDFKIDELTGALSVAKRLDYERKNQYELTLQVRKILPCLYQDLL